MALTVPDPVPGKNICWNVNHSSEVRHKGDIGYYWLSCNSHCIAITKERLNHTWYSCVD